MRFSIAYDEDGTILTAASGGEDVLGPLRSGDMRDLFDAAYRVPDAELNKAIEGRQDEMAAKKLMQENARQEADDGQP
jgi:hypothetical protein